MKTTLLFSLSAAALVAMTACSGSSDDGAVDQSNAAISDSEIKKDAKKAIAHVIKVEKHGDGTDTSLSAASDRDCNEVIASVKAPSSVAHSRDLSDLKVRAVGGDARAAKAAVEALCLTAVNGLGASCDVSHVKVLSFDKSECKRSKVYVGVVGTTKAAEDAIGRHHHFDEYKDGALRLDGRDDDADAENDLWEGDDGTTWVPEIVGD